MSTFPDHYAYYRNLEHTADYIDIKFKKDNEARIDD
jgi:hypothetical protein